MNELEELARLGVEFTLSHTKGQWVLASEHGFALDCTLSSCVERVLQQERDRPSISEAVAAEVQRRKAIPPAALPDTVLQLQFQQDGKVRAWSDGKRSVEQVAHLLRVVAIGFESGQIEQVE